jgi:hypothetical protein
MKYEYPRIVQIMPCSNIWLRYDDKDNDTCFYERAHCLALMEMIDCYGKIMSDLQYIGMDHYGIIELDCSANAVFYSIKDLSELTHSLLIECHPDNILEGIVQ